ncbi:MAG: helicase-exonuclease AddAB subunit AddA [Selenomonadaceae bacterium]|nr:helicase-exonuclease AddAB subunit AddA [Selenomonadaceae bacterium]
MQWTNQQLDAINSRNKNLLVAAAAGSGKTAVLVERIVKLIEEDNFDVDKMLIVTFTNAAANELKMRIHKDINEKIAAAFSDEVEKLERQNILLSAASIMTFHAFCLSVLRRHFAKINLDPRFREADEHELNIIKQEVIEDLFEERYAQNDADFIKFTDNFGGNVHGDNDLHKLIIKLHSFSQSRPYPQAWLNSLAELYDAPENFKLDDGTNWLAALQQFALSQAEIAVNYAKIKSSSVKSQVDIIFGSQKINIGIKATESDYAQIKELAAAFEDWDKLCEKLQLLEFVRLDGAKKIPVELQDVKEEVKIIRDSYKDKLKNLRENFVTNTTAEIISEMKNLADFVRQLVKITIEFDNAFAAAKRERNIIDFNDMEHLALKIFNENPVVAQIYRNKFNVVMIDEYQDTNGVQEEIISKIVRADNFFAVGDVKQSIYRFRNADPTIFLDKYKNFPALENCARIDLSTNFRSRRNVIDAVNFVFQNTMTEENYEIDYDEAAQLNLGANYPVGENILDDKAELLLIGESEKGKVESEDVEENAPEIDKLEIELQIIADKINSLLRAEKKIWDNDLNAYRKIEFRDIVILFRSIDRAAAQIVEVLQKNNIPAYAADKDGYFRAVEIQTILCLLKILDNARQDIPLATVLLSPIGGFSAEDLAKIRIVDRNADLYSLICGDTKFQPFLEKINRWREIARQVSVPELLNLIYRETGYYDYCAKFGRIAQANLRMLIDRAAAYEKTAFRGLSRFIQFIKKIKDLGNDLAAARTLSESENVVRVMTVHKSKGLEFPVVFVAGLGKKFNFQDLKEMVIPHRNFGVGILQPLESGARVNTFARRIISQKVKAEMLAEELRILYVAMTRAKEKLFLSGVSNSNSEKINCPLDWLLKLNLDEVFDVIKIDSVDLGSRQEAEGKREQIVSKAKPPEKLPAFENIPAKLSVTELKRRINEDEEVETFTAEKNIYKRPNFLQKKEITGAEYGTIMHSVMQHLNFGGDLTRAGILRQIEEIIRAQIINPEHAEIIKRRAGSIANFFNSDIGKKAVLSKEIYKELPFSFYVDAKSTGVFNSNEKILVQGIIDLLFKYNGKWFLVDYKTDSDNTDEYFQQEYRQQINYYAQAIEAVAKIKVDARYLYLLGAGRFIDIF